jgi:hypothetical protein
MSLSVTILPSTSTTSPNWVVEKNDSCTYIYTKVYFIYNDPPLSFQEKKQAETGESVVIKHQTGIKISYRINKIEGHEVTLRVIYNESLYLKQEKRSGYSFPIRKTTPEKDYWEEYFEDYETIKVSGDLIIREYSERGTFWNKTEIEAWNWKTGWTEYYYEKVWNEDMIALEKEMIAIPENSQLSENSTFGWFLLIVILALLTITHIPRYKGRKKAT